MELFACNSSGYSSSGVYFDVATSALGKLGQAIPEKRPEVREYLDTLSNTEPSKSSFLKHNRIVLRVALLAALFL